MDASMPGCHPSALLRLAAALLLGAACAGEASSSTVIAIDTEDQKLSVADEAAGDIYGAAVALHGDLAVVASEYDDEAGADSGSVYVFRDDGERWVMEQKLLPSDGQEGDNFGRSVAVQGARIVIGAHWDDDQGSKSGSAYVFRHDGERWVQEQKLLAPGGKTEDRFGVSVSLDGEVIGVTAWRDDGAGRDAGAVHMFRHDGTRWVAEQKLTASDAQPGANFGRSVSISGQRLVVGAWKDDGAGKDSGAAYVFRHDGERWVQEQKLQPDDASAGDVFGWCAQLDGEVVLVGAHEADAAAPGAGAAYVFRLDGDRWVQEQKLVAPDGEPGDWFGFSASLQGELALVGAYRPRGQKRGPAGAKGRPGTVYVFRREGGSWVRSAALGSSDGVAGDAFGFQVSTHGGRALVGAWRTAQAGRETGSAYSFRKP
jgi:hypothetical protein